MVKTWTLSRRWNQVIDATDLIDASSSSQICVSDALKAQAAVLIHVNGIASVSETKERSNRFEIYFLMRVI